MEKAKIKTSILTKSLVSINHHIKKFTLLKDLRYRHIREFRLKELFKAFFEIKELKNGIVYMHDDSMHKIIEVDPIFYYNLEKSKREEINSKFFNVLSQIYHPIQIVLRTVNVNIKDKVNFID